MHKYLVIDKNIGLGELPTSLMLAHEIISIAIAVLQFSDSERKLSIV